MTLPEYSGTASTLDSTTAFTLAYWFKTSTLSAAQGIVDYLGGRRPEFVFNREVLG